MASPLNLSRLNRSMLLGGLILIYLLYLLSASESLVPAFLRAPSPERILLVTAYYPLPKSKHSQAEYDHWLTNLMGQLSTDMYIFTTSAYETRLQQLIAKAVNSDLTISRNHSSAFAQRKVYYDTRYQSPLETPPLAGLASKAKEQWEMDPEKDRHNPELYAIWDSKAYFMGEAVRAMEEAKETVPSYKYIFWEDAGAMRGDHLLQAWPDMARVEEVFGEMAAETSDPTDPLILFPFWRVPYPHEKSPSVGEDSKPPNGMLTEGSFFGGTPSSVLWFEEAFYSLLNRLLAKSFFVGKDQDLFNLLIALNPSIFFGPIPNAYPDLAQWGAYPCGDTWYYYHFWLASTVEMAETARWRGIECPLVPPQKPFM